MNTSGATPSSAQPSVWMYLSGLAVAFCGLLAARIVIEDQRFTSTMMVLVLLGFAFSFVARRMGWFEQSPGLFIRWLFAGLIVYALLNFWMQGWVLPFDVETTYGGTAIAFLCWLVVFASFMLASDEHVLFIAVPVVALLGVAAPALSAQQAFWLFTTFLGNTAFLLAHENTRRLYGAAKPDTLFMRGQVAVALVCGLMAALTGIIVSWPLRDATLRLSGNSLPPGLASAISNSNTSSSFTQPAIAVGSGPVSLSEQPVLEIQSSEPLYWRGSVYVRYTGRGWANPRYGFFTQQLFNLDAPFQSIPERRDGLYTLTVPPVSPEPIRYREVKQRFKLLHGAANIIYAAAQPVRIRFPNLAVRVDATGCLQTFYGYRSGAEYEVISHVPDATPDDLRQAPPATPRDVGAIYFELPAQTSQRLQNLARELTTRHYNNYDKVMALKTYIESTCDYNLNAQAVPVGRDAVEFFLFESREGYCDLFSTALAVLARYAGIPSRVATGFLTGDPQPDGKFIAREKHRHQWTEIYFPGYGWVTFDATEGARDVTGSQYRKGKGEHFWKVLTRRYGYLPWLIAITAAILLFFAMANELFARRTGRCAISRIVRCYLQAVRALQRVGVARSDWMTPSEYAAKVQKAVPEAAESLWALTRLLERSEYGRGVAEAEAVQAEKHLQQIRSALKRRYRWWWH
ncbi:MAG: transglutaminase TgpA family protein [Armatimonadota bacterium]